MAEMKERIKKAFEKSKSVFPNLDESSFNWGFIEGISCMAEIDREYQEYMRNKIKRDTA